MQPKTSSRANPDSMKNPKTKKTLDNHQRNTIVEQSVEESYSNTSPKEMEIDFDEIRYLLPLLSLTLPPYRPTNKPHDYEYSRPGMNAYKQRVGSSKARYYKVV